jgi:putative hydrolase of the HAD superfamily
MYAGEAPIPARTVLLDALGTLVHFDDPAPRLRAGLRRTLGIEVDPRAASAAVREEIAHYRANLHRGADAKGLMQVREECAEVVARSLELRGVPIGIVLGVLLDAIRFEPYPDAEPALRALRAAGARLVVASNWDISLHEVLARTGLAALVDGAVSSAEVGSAKPDPGVFERALALADEDDAAAACHVGDSPVEDVEGARRAGVVPVLIARRGERAPAGVRAIASLAELPGLLGR